MLMRDEHRDDAIDELIATAARAMTAGEPTRALRTGVRDGITRSRSVWPLVPALAGAAVLVAVAIVVGRALLGAPDEPAVHPTTEVAMTDVTKAAGQEPVRETAAPATTQFVRATTRRPVARVRPPLEDEEPVIPPIAIEPLVPTQIVVDTRSGVMPIEIEPLQIEPLQGSGQ